jgi:hypothetical protein
MDFWIRGAMAEFAAFIWLPLIALAIQRLPERRGVVLLGLSLGGLILSHLPVAMLACTFLVAPLTLHRIWQDRATLLPAIIGGSLGIGLAALYLLPALTLQGHISASLLWTPYYQPARWSILAPDTLMPSVTLPFVALAMVVLAAPTRSIWSLIALVAGLAAVGLIPGLWEVPPFSKAQFPWRLLCIVEFAGITALVMRRPHPVIAGTALALLLIPYMVWSQQAVEDLQRPVDYARIARTLPEAPEYLPAGFDLKLVPQKDRVTDVSPFRHLPRGPVIRVDRPGPVTLHHAAFPSWRVTRDGREVPSTGPLITFQAQPGTYRLERVILWQEIAGGLASLLAATLLLLLQLGSIPLPRSPGMEKGETPGTPAKRAAAKN